MKKLLTFIFLLLPFFLFAQKLTGRVFDASTNEPLSGVNVYYSGTSIGTITDFEGNFEIKNYDNDQSALVIRLLGYDTQQFVKPQNADLSAVLLKEQVGALPAVYINPDPWSREKKERYFIKQFIGTTLVAEKCRILNLDKVRMRFNPSTKKMTAYAEEPVLIENDDLGYLITYDLTDFEITFETIDLTGVRINGLELKNPSYKMVSSYFVGTTFFQELNSKRPSQRRRKKNRKRAYAVSETKLFKSLANGSFDDAGYQLFFDRKTANYDDHIRSRQIGNLYKIDFRELKYDLKDRDGFQSAIYLKGHQLIVSEAGNVINYQQLQMGGFISELRVSGMLPLDFNPKN